jgi:hypothetical protein
MDVCGGRGRGSPSAPLDPRVNLGGHTSQHRRCPGGGPGLRFRLPGGRPPDLTWRGGDRPLAPARSPPWYIPHRHGRLLAGRVDPIDPTSTQKEAARACRPSACSEPRTVLANTRHPTLRSLEHGHESSRHYFTCRCPLYRAVYVGVWFMSSVGRVAIAGRTRSTVREARRCYASPTGRVARPETSIGVVRHYSIEYRLGASNLLTPGEQCDDRSSHHVPP